MKIVVYGAGSIGCYIGSILHLQKLDVTLLGRPRIKKVIEDNGGIAISDYEGRSNKITDLQFATDPNILNRADVVLVTLKCTAMKSAAEELNHYVKPNALIVCLQNGVGAEQPVLELVKQAKVVTGIVPFNVVQDDKARFYRGTEGGLHFPNAEILKPLQKAYMDFGLDCQLESDMPSVMWGKLQLNLNNAINALSDLPLKTQLSQRSYRRILASCQEELLTACRVKGIQLAKLTAVKPGMIPKILRLPDFLFTLIAQKMLAIDPEARSSMWEDVKFGRKTEVDFLNGAVVSLAKEMGIDAPVNEKVCQLIHEVESGEIQTGLSGEELVKYLPVK